MTNTTTQSTPLARCLAYVAKMPPSIEGSYGHRALYAVAAKCVEFGLTEGEAAQVLAQYNLSASPPWGEAGLNAAIRKAYGREVAGKFDAAKRPTPAARPTTQKAHPTQAQKAQALGAFLAKIGKPAPTPPGKQSGEVAPVRPAHAAPNQAREVAQTVWGEDGPPLWDGSLEASPNAAPPPAMTQAPIDAMTPEAWGQWWAAYHPGIPNPDSAQPLAIAQAAYAQAEAHPESTPQTAPHPQAPDTRQTVGKQSATLGRNLGAQHPPRPKLPNAQTPAGRLIAAAWASIAGEAGYIPNAPLSAQPAALGAAWVAYVVAGKHAPNTPQSTPQTGGEVA